MGNSNSSIEEKVWTATKFVGNVVVRTGVVMGTGVAAIALAPATFATCAVVVGSITVGQVYNYYTGEDTILTNIKQIGEHGLFSSQGGLAVLSGVLTVAGDVGLGKAGSDLVKTFAKRGLNSVAQTTATSEVNDMVKQGLIKEGEEAAKSIFKETTFQTIKIVIGRVLIFAKELLVEMLKLKALLLASTALNLAGKGCSKWARSIEQARIDEEKLAQMVRVSSAQHQRQIANQEARDALARAEQEMMEQQRRRNQAEAERLQTEMRIREEEFARQNLAHLRDEWNLKKSEMQALENTRNTECYQLSLKYQEQLHDKKIKVGATLEKVAFQNAGAIKKTRTHQAIEVLNFNEKTEEIKESMEEQKGKIESAIRVCLAVVDKFYGCLGSFGRLSLSQVDHKSLKKCIKQQTD